MTYDYIVLDGLVFTWVKKALQEFSTFSSALTEVSSNFLYFNLSTLIKESFSSHIAWAPDIKFLA